MIDSSIVSNLHLISNHFFQHGHLAAEFDEFLQRARSNDTYKQCKKNCDREYAQGTTANANCHKDCDSAYEDWNYFPTGGQCKKRCKTSKDCQVGGFNPCGECGEYVGTAMYQLCYAPEPTESTPAPSPWNYFPDGGQCSKRCKTDSDCQKGGFNPCGSCGKYEGTLMYQRCYAPELEEEKETKNDAALDFLEDKEESGNTCGTHCHTDSDCWKGGVVECGTCNQIHGTYGYHTCISESTPAPSPWNYFPDGGQCSKHCHKDSDCQKGGFNPCGSCGQYEGTLMYHRCYAPEPEDSTPAPSPWNYFPDGGQCSNHCKTDSDCQKGGFNPCGSCGKYEGTLMYQRCYAPEPTFFEE